MFNGLDHIAIVVADTEEALKVWRDCFGFEVVHSEKVNNDTTLLTHLDLGNTQLQLVQPLTDTHPLAALLQSGDSVLHHVCFLVDDIDTAFGELPAIGLRPDELQPHQGTQGRRALFLDRSATDGVQVELTGN
jgi:methylmalonyl-CoA/ethylmalonyl-CoA epimerase